MDKLRQLIYEEIKSVLKEFHTDKYDDLVNFLHTFNYTVSYGLVKADPKKYITLLNEFVNDQQKEIDKIKTWLNNFDK